MNEHRLKVVIVGSKCFEINGTSHTTPGFKRTLQKLVNRMKRRVSTNDGK